MNPLQCVWKEQFFYGLFGQSVGLDPGPSLTVVSIKLVEISEASTRFEARGHQSQLLHL